MANEQTNALPSVAAIAVGDTFVGNDASSGDTAQFTLPAFDARYAQLAGANIFSAGNTFNGTLSVGASFIESTNAGGMGINVQGANQLFFGTGSKIAMYSGEIFGWNSGVPNSGASDTALARAAAGVIEVNDGTPGTGHGAAINFPRTTADADAPAPASGATLYSKQVVGKNALFVRFPTGVVQQLAIEL